MMLRKNILTSTLAASLILPVEAEAKLIFPPKPKLELPSPAIVRAESLELSKHMLLGMPLTMGMLIPSISPTYISSSAGAATISAQTISWSHTTTSDTTALVVVAGITTTSTTNPTITATFNGVSTTSVRRRVANSYWSVHIHVLYNPPIGTFTLSVTASASINRHFSAHAVNLGGVSAVNTSNDNYSATATTISASLTTTQDAVVVVGSLGQNSGTSNPTFSYSSPATTTRYQETTNTANSNDRTTATGASTLQSPRTFNVTSVGTYANQTHIVVAAAFRA